jgi:hypothetical protein
MRRFSWGGICIDPSAIASRSRSPISSQMARQLVMNKTQAFLDDEHLFSSDSNARNRTKIIGIANAAGDLSCW